MLSPQAEAFKRLLSLISDEGVIALWRAATDVAIEERILLQTEMKCRGLRAVSATASLLLTHKAGARKTCGQAMENAVA
jgi:hypothetical protein